MRNTPSTFVQEGDDVQLVDFFTGDAENTTDAQNKAENLASALKDDPESFVTIHKLLGAGNMPEQYCTRFPADKFDIGQIQQLLATDYGAGDYRVRIYIKGRVKGNKLVSIAGKLKPDASAPHSSETAGILETVLNRMEANTRQMLTVLQNSAQPPAIDRAAFMQELLMMKQIFSNDKPSGGLGQLTEALDVLKTLGVNVGNTIEHQKEEGFGDLIDKMSPLLEAAITSSNQPKQPPQINPEIARQKQMNMIQRIALKSKLEPFIKAAAKNSDQAVYAEMLIDQVDEKTLNEYANNPLIFDELVKIDSRIAAHKNWFLDLLEHVRAMLGYESRFSDLYADHENDINGETIEPESQHNDSKL